MIREMSAIGLEEVAMKDFVTEVEVLFRDSGGDSASSQETTYSRKGGVVSVQQWCWTEMTGQVRVKYNSAPIKRRQVVLGGSYEIRVSFFDRSTALEWAIKIVEVCSRLHINTLGLEGYGNKDLYQQIAVACGCHLSSPHGNNLRAKQLLQVLEKIAAIADPILDRIRSATAELETALGSVTSNPHCKIARSASASLLAGLSQ